MVHNTAYHDKNKYSDIHGIIIKSSNFIFRPEDVSYIFYSFSVFFPLEFQVTLEKEWNFSKIGRGRKSGWLRGNNQFRGVGVKGNLPQLSGTIR